MACRGTVGRVGVDVRHDLFGQRVVGCCGVLGDRVRDQLDHAAPLGAEAVNRDVVTRWVAALRSGEYEQGSSALRQVRADGTCLWCCLGVLADVAANGKARWGPSTAWGARTAVVTDFCGITPLDDGGTWMGTLLTDETWWELAGDIRLPPAGRTVAGTVKIGVVTQATFAAWNDGTIASRSLRFDEIADLVEELYLTPS